MNPHRTSHSKKVEPAIVGHHDAGRGVRWAGVWAIAVALIAIGIYANTMSAPFIYDDFGYIVHNDQIRDGDKLIRVFVLPYPADRPQLGLYRPVTILSYALDASVGGLEPKTFHRTNVLLHAGTCVLVLLLLLRLHASLPVAVCGAMLFALHPVHTEAVAWVVGRAEVLAAFFSLASLLLYLRYRNTGGLSALGLSVGCYFLALGSKEIAAPVPAILLSGEILRVFGHHDGLRKPRLLLPLGAFGIVLSIYVGLRLTAIGAFGMVDESTVFTTQPVSTRLLTAVAGLFEYLRLSLIPFDLRIDYSEFAYSNFFAPKVLAGLGVPILLALAAWRVRRLSPLPALAVAWFFLFLLPVSNLLIPIGAVLAERFLYLPSVAVSLAVTGIIEAASRLRGQSFRNGLLGIGCVALVAYAAGTVTRNRVWIDTERFWRTAAAQSATSQKAELALYKWLRGEGKKAEAEQVLRAAASRRLSGDMDRLSGEDVELVHNLAHLEREKGRFDSALFLYERTISLSRKFGQLTGRIRFESEAQYCRGLCLIELDRREEALQAFQAAQDLRPDWALPREALGTLRPAP